MKTTQLHTISVPKGAHKKRKVVGRGRSSGHGKTSCRGQTGQKSRSGYSMQPGFEGGQMPLIRRIPKRGFTSLKRTKARIVNVEELMNFSEESVVSPEILKEKGSLRNGEILKILGNGEIKHALTVKAHKFSASSKEKIVKAGGKVEVINAKINKSLKNA